MYFDDLKLDMNNELNRRFREPFHGDLIPLAELRSDDSRNALH